MLKFNTAQSSQTPENPALFSHKKNDSQFGHYIGKRNLNVLIYAIFLTFFFAFIEAIAGWISHSLALISDAVHMLTDSAGLGLALMAQLISRRRPSPRYTFGFGSSEVLTAFINCLVMLAIVGWITFEALERLTFPQNVHAKTVIFVSSIGLAINIVVAWILAQDQKSINTKAALVHVIGDLLGSVAAIIAGIVISLTGWMQIDPILSILVSLLILKSTLLILYQSWHFLMKGVPKHIDFLQVGRDLESIVGISSIHDLHIWEMAPNEVALIGHVEIVDLSQWPTILQTIRNTLMIHYNIDHITFQAELITPDSKNH